MKKTFKYLFYIVLIPIVSVFTYIIISYIFTLFPKEIPQSLNKTKNVYILYNEMHSDIAFPIQDFNRSLFPEFQNKKTGYLLFGWGDKETYLNTPQWTDLTLSTTLKALFINTPTLMHVSYIPNIHKYLNVKTIKLSVSEKTYLKNAILKDFNFEGKHYKGYEEEDFFYTAHKPYNLINTCNTWTGDKLREANVSMPYWTPFASSVVNALP